MKAKKILALLLVCITLISLAACGDGTTAPTASNSSTTTSSGGTTPDGGTPSVSGTAPDAATPAPDGGAPEKDTLRVSVEADTGTLDPVGLSAGGYANVCWSYMEPLWDYREGWELVWVLATGIDDISPLQMTIHLREGIKFSNGNDFNADDVLFTLALWRDTPNRNPVVAHVDFDKTTKIDDYTIDLHFNYEMVSRKIMLSSVLMADAESYDPAVYSLTPIGTGPYIVTEYLVNSHLYMEARDDYWGEKPGIPNLQFLVLAEATQRVNALVTDTVDLSIILTQDVEYVETLPRYEIAQYWGAVTRSVFYNTHESNIFSNLDARNAVSYAIDRQAIVNIVYNGFAEVINAPASKYSGDYEARFENLADIYTIGYDPALAKQYAESSGLVDREVRIMTNGAPEYVAMAEIIQTNLQDIGVAAVINNYDQATLRATYRTDPEFYDICLYFTGVTDNKYGSILQRVTQQSQIFSESDWPGKERFMELCPQVIALDDEAARKDMLFEMTQLFVDANIFYALCDIAQPYAVAEDIEGLWFSSNGGIRFKDLSYS